MLERKLDCHLNMAYLIKGGVVSLIGRKSSEGCQLFTILGVFHSAQFENRTEGFLHLGEFFLIITLRNLREQLDHAFYNDGSQLFHKFI